MTEKSDYVDTVTERWESIHPDIDCGPLSVTLRLIRAGRILQAELDEIAAGHGFAVPGDYELLAALRRSHPKGLQPTALAERLMVTTSGITGRLDRLEQAQLIVRRSHPKDRRAISIHITEAGIEAADAVFTERTTAESIRFGNIPDNQLRQLADLLRVVLTELGDHLQEVE